MRTHTFRRKKRLGAVREENEPEEEPSPLTSQSLRLASVQSGAYVAWGRFGESESSTNLIILGGVEMGGECSLTCVHSVPFQSSDASVPTRQYNSQGPASLVQEPTYSRYLIEVDTGVLWVHHVGIQTCSVEYLTKPEQDRTPCVWRTLGEPRSCGMLPSGIRSMVHSVATQTEDLAVYSTLKEPTHHRKPEIAADLVCDVATQTGELICMAWLEEDAESYMGQSRQRTSKPKLSSNKHFVVAEKATQTEDGMDSLSSESPELSQESVEICRESRYDDMQDFGGRFY